METLVASLLVAFVGFVLCYIVEKLDVIPVHLDPHREPVLVGLTGGAVGFFASMILIMVTHLM